MATQATTDGTFDEDVLGSPDTVVVDFWAEWCAPCKAIAPHLEELSDEVPGVKIVKLNIDENQSTAVKYGVRSIPTLIKFKGGEPVDIRVGAQGGKSELQKWIEGA